MSTSSSASGLHILHDSGVPNESADYTTLVILHGYAWQSGIFSRLPPLANQYNTRVVLINRRDYPGARPYTEEERAQLHWPSDRAESAAGADETEVAAANVDAWMTARGREVHDLLCELVEKERIPVAAGEPAKGTGGIVVAGWSFGTIWMTALLASIPSPTDNESTVDLSKYVRRVVFFDPPFIALGYAPPPNPGYHPLLSSPTNDTPPSSRPAAFARWVGGYYAHGPTAATLHCRPPLAHPYPPPTLDTLTPAERASTLCAAPGVLGVGSDALLLETGLRVRAFERLKVRALFPWGRGEKKEQGPEEGEAGLAQADADGGGSVGMQNGDGGGVAERAATAREDAQIPIPWPDVEVRHVSCEHSVWDIPWCLWSLKAELERANAKKEQVRAVRLVHVRGGNHFVHWDNPELAMRALVGDEDLVE